MVDERLGRFEAGETREDVRTVVDELDAVFPEALMVLQ